MTSLHDCMFGSHKFRKTKAKFVKSPPAVSKSYDPCKDLLATTAPTAAGSCSCCQWWAVLIFAVRCGACLWCVQRGTQQKSRQVPSAGPARALVKAN